MQVNMRRCMACGRSVPETEIRKARECPALKLCEGCNSPSKRMLILARVMRPKTGGGR